MSKHKIYIQNNNTLYITMCSVNTLYTSPNKWAKTSTDKYFNAHIRAPDADYT